jgi:hypothetical protein
MTRCAACAAPWPPPSTAPDPSRTSRTGPIPVRTTAFDDSDESALPDGSLRSPRFAEAIDQAGAGLAAYL